MKLTVAVMEEGRAFVILAGAPGEPPQEPGRFFRGELAFSWGFYLEPLDDQTTRLLIRTRGRPGPTPRRPSSPSRSCSSPCTS